MRKNVPGAEFFLPVGFIEHASAICFSERAEERHLQGLPRERFVQQLAYHYEKINYIHPFREGNGRTQRFSGTVSRCKPVGNSTRLSI